MIEVIGITTLLGYLRESIAKMTDPRNPSPNKQYSIADLVLSANVVFFRQCESFLEYQRQLNSRKGRDNAQTLFGVNKLSRDNQIRNILSKIKPIALFEVCGFAHIALFMSPKYRVLSFRQEAGGRGQEGIFKLYFSQVKTAILLAQPLIGSQAHQQAKAKADENTDSSP